MTYSESQTIDTPSVESQVATPGLGYGFESRRKSRQDPLRSTRDLWSPDTPTKRPRGQFLVICIALLCCGFVAYHIWNTFFRYRAYGTVHARLVKISSPSNSSIAYLHVDEGDRVTQGQAIVSVEQLEKQHRLDELHNQLRLAEANLSAEVSKLKSQRQWEHNRHQGALTEHYRLLSTYLEQKSMLTRKQLALHRIKRLHQRKAAVDEELEQAKLAVSGQRIKVEKLKDAVSESEKRVAPISEKSETGTALLKPYLMKLESIQAEIDRVREQLKQGEICAPLNGTVIRRYHSVGEQVKEHEPLYSVLDEHSLEIILYIPQSSSDLFEYGQELSLNIPPYPEPLLAKIVRFGDQLEVAPENLSRYYPQNTRLLPVHLKPYPEYSRWMALRIGQVVMLPQ